MANSPLVVPGDAGKATSTDRSKLSSNAASKDGTPEVAQSSNGTGRDLAEQMNEDEKQKYVKGTAPYYPSTITILTLTKAGNSEKEPTPTSTSVTSAPTLQSSSP